MLSIYVPVLNKVLGTRPLNSGEKGMVFIFSLAPLAIGQTIRWARHFLKPGSEA